MLSSYFRTYLKIQKLQNFKSITLTNLAKLLESLSKIYKLPVEEITSYTIRDFILGKKKVKDKRKENDTGKEMRSHPAELFPQNFSEDEHEVAVTHEWSLGLNNVSGILKLAENKNQDLKIWIDVLFVDQMCTNVCMNLASAQEVYGRSEEHWIFGTPTLLSRGWCLYEICIRKNSKRPSLILGDLGYSVDLLCMKAETYFLTINMADTK